MQQPSLTFLHGFMGDTADWDELRDSLDAGDGSDLAMIMHAPPILPAKDWESGLGQLANSIPKHSLLIGYSMGARLALSLAMEFPERTCGLVLISGNPGLQSDLQRKTRFDHDEALASKIETLSAAEETRQFLEEWYQQSVFATTSDAVRQCEIERKLLQQNRSSWPDVLRTFSVARQPNYWLRLHSLKIPVLLIAGEKDEKYCRIANRFVEASNSNTTTATIVPDCGHIVHREQTATVSRVINEFRRR
ncbi:MAG: alpha/beta fold hydrolase [Planctomycetota bacterium]